MLSEEGIDALVRGKLDATNPPLDCIVRQHQRPAAIYFWLLFARGTTAAALALVMEKLQTPLYRDVDVFARTASKAGDQFSEALGFQRGIWWDGEFYPRISHYWRSPRPPGPGDSQLAARLAAPFAQPVPHQAPATNLITTSVVHGFDDMLSVVAIRAAVYMGEQGCPYEEEFDGNDFSGTHMIGRIGATPAGCLRIRYFGEFAKIERVAVLERFRHRGLARRMVSAAASLCAEKGFTQLYAHAQKRLLPFWIGLGFHRLRDAQSFVFSDFEYVEIVRDIDAHSRSKSLIDGPYLLIRPEGQWDRPGILERSVQRPARA
jgi:predicted GNAT family N-acyltransferase